MYLLGNINTKKNNPCIMNVPNHKEHCFFSCLSSIINTKAIAKDEEITDQVSYYIKKKNCHFFVNTIFEGAEWVHN